jgi:hypothetical protein
MLSFLADAAAPRRRVLATTAAGLLLAPAGARRLRAQPADPLAPWHAAPAMRNPDWRLRAAA